MPPEKVKQRLVNVDVAVLLTLRGDEGTGTGLSQAQIIAVAALNSGSMVELASSSLAGAEGSLTKLVSAGLVEVVSGTAPSPRYRLTDKGDVRAEHWMVALDGLICPTGSERGWLDRADWLLGRHRQLGLHEPATQRRLLDALSLMLDEARRDVEEEMTKEP